MLTDDGRLKTVSGHGNGPVAGFVAGLRKETGIAFDLADYREHAIGSGATTAAAAYVELRFPGGGGYFGVGIDKNIVTASLKAVVSGLNRALKQGPPAKAEATAAAPAAPPPAEPAASVSRVAAVLKRGHGLDLPAKLEAEFAQMIEALPGTPSPEQIWREFETEYLSGTGDYGFIALDSQADAVGGGPQAMTARVTVNNVAKTITGKGSGPLAGFVDAMRHDSGLAFELAGYREHMIGTGAGAEVAAYVELRMPSGRSFHGVGIDTSMAVASLKAVVSGVNRALKRR
jgi:hypothetical protein